MQVISQSSQFQDGTSSSLAYRNPSNVESVPSVPTTWDTVYDPDHPDADWSGLVSKEVIFAKKHDLNHPSHREGIERTELGIVSKQERQEFPRKRSNNDAVTRNSGSLVIGGIDNPNDRFNTTYRRFENQEKTEKDQLILEKRVHATRHVPDPAKSVGAMQSSDAYHAAKQNSMQMNPRSFDRDTKYNPRASLLSNIGDSLIASNAIQAPPTQSATEYRSEKYRTMIGDNFKQFPGYTGHRR
jgi:hypothetical protein